MPSVRRSTVAHSGSSRPLRMTIGARFDHRLARASALRAVPGQRGGIEEGLGEGAAVDMHLLVSLAVQRHLDHGRRKRAGDRGRGQQDAADRVGGPRMAALGDRADVPDHRHLRIEVGRADQQQAARVVGLGDGGQHAVVDIARDGLEQRLVVGHRIVEHGGGQRALGQDLVRRRFGVDGAQLRIVGRAQECERSRECAGADAGHQIERRARALRRSSRTASLRRRRRSRRRPIRRESAAAAGRQACETAGADLASMAATNSASRARSPCSGKNRSLGMPSTVASRGPAERHRRAAFRQGAAGQAGRQRAAGGQTEDISPRASTAFCQMI